jgi:hypothetical protein
VGDLSSSGIAYQKCNANSPVGGGGTGSGTPGSSEVTGALATMKPAGLATFGARAPVSRKSERKSVEVAMRVFTGRVSF